MPFRNGDCVLLGNPSMFYNIRATFAIFDLNSRLCDKTTTFYYFYIMSEIKSEKSTSINELFK